MFERQSPPSLGGGFVLALVLAVLLLGLLATSALAQYAYVVNEGSDNVSVIDTQTNKVVGSSIVVGEWPDSIAITPDGKTAYVANGRSDSVSVIDTQTDQVVGSPISVGKDPSGIAITPNGRTAYVTDSGSNNVSMINTQTNEVVGSPISVGTHPSGIAITPDGKTAYVTNYGVFGEEFGSVSVIETQTNEVVGSPISVDREPIEIAIAPDGRSAYLTNYFDGRVSVINTQTNQLLGPLGDEHEPNGILVGSEPIGIAITPNGKSAYVATTFGGGVWVIDTQTNEVAKQILAEGKSWNTKGIAITPDGKSAYVTDQGNSVRVIDTQTNEVVGSPISVGEAPSAIAITPDQPPVAAFSAPAQAEPGNPVIFDASASTYPEGSTPSYEWEFGDGSSEKTTGSATSHTYSTPGTYIATLTVTDNICSTEFIFTGQTAYCNGSTLASKTQAVTVVAGLSNLPMRASHRPFAVCIVPALRGNKLGLARKRLRLADCKLGKVKGLRSRSATVIKQNPSPGRVIGADNRVTVRVG